MTRTARPRILCVDDEPHILESLRDTLHRYFTVETAGSGAEGLAMLGDHPRDYAVVISDMRMPVMTGSVFLREARRVAPDAARILLTGHADLEAAVSAVNDAQLFRFLTKPCPREELFATCEAAVEQNRLQTAERDLLEQTLKGAVKALADVLAVASPAAFGRSSHVRDIAARIAAAAGVEEPWMVEVAALLANLGAVTLPAEVSEKLYAGSKLTPPEEQMVERVPRLTRQILGNIPRLDGVLEILDSYGRSYGAVGAGRSLPVGARILRIALDYDILLSHGVSESVAVAALRGRGLKYDPDLLTRLGHAVGDPSPNLRVLELPLRHLMPGMMLADDVRGTNGALLIARGHAATDQLIARLHNLGAGSVAEPVLVYDETSDSKPR